MKLFSLLLIPKWIYCTFFELTLRSKKRLSYFFSDYSHGDEEKSNNFWAYSQIDGEKFYNFLAYSPLGFPNSNSLNHKSNIGNLKSLRHNGIFQIKTVSFKKRIFFIRCSIFLIIILFYFATPAEIIDTTIFGDGGPGPYVLGSSFVNSQSITVSFADSSSVPPWIYIEDNNGVLFSEQIDTGKAMRFRFSTMYYGLPKIYSLYPKISLKFRDTLKMQTEKKQSVSLLNQSENLSVSGYKSISVAAGNLGQISLEQGLDVQIGGELRPGTELKAHFSDQGSTLDGATREISEFDMIYVTLSDPKFNILAGDQYIKWPMQGILSSQKKIKGLSVSVHPGLFSVGAFGALSGGNFTKETWHGKNGMQGPYSFSGKGEQGIITPIAGTIKLKVNGKTLEEGEDKDFTVDYDLGSVTFNPKILIRDEDLIIVEYEYKLFDFQRSVVGTTAGFFTNDSIFSVQGVLWSEADNKNRLIDISFDSSDMAELRKAGDKPVFGYNDRAVHVNDVPEVSRYEPLYQKVDTLGKIIFRFKPFDPVFPQDRDGRFRVYFSHAGKGKGSYIRDVTVSEYEVYKYVGENAGDYLPLTALSTPKRMTAGEISGNLQLDMLKMKINVAGQDYDKNLFSKIDDHNNRASAVRATMLAGQKRFDKRSAWLSADYNYSSRHFNVGLFDTYDRYDKWDDSTYDESEAERQFWEGKLGVTPFKLLSAELGYGQNQINSNMITDKFTWYSRTEPLKKLLLDYEGTLFRHHENSRKGMNRKGIARLVYQQEKHNVELAYKDEWRRDSLKEGIGTMAAVLQYGFLPWNLVQTFDFRQFRAGKTTLFEATDTGWAFSWEQSIDNQLLSWWKINGLSSFYTEKNRTGDKQNRFSSTSFLIDLNSEMSSLKTGFSSTQRYRLSSEKVSSFIQVPVLTVKGHGTHSYNDSLKEYVPDPFGDYFLQQREVYDSTDGLVRKKRLDLNWSYRHSGKIKGILNDLNWFGTLLLDEHVDSKTPGWKAWVPGWLSLEEIRHPFNSKNVSYSDLSYRQQIQWMPKEWENLSGELFGQMSLRKIRSYQETSTESGFNIQIKHENLTFSDESRYCYVFHNDSLIQDFYVRDFNTVLAQRLEFAKKFEFYVQECIGWARMDDTYSKDKAVKPDSSFYVQLNPGFQWRPFDQSWAEASYMYSFVPIPGELDYRMARGISAGLSHIASIAVNFQLGKHFSLSGSYRGEMNRPLGRSSFEKGLHTVSMEMKAFL